MAGPVGSVAARRSQSGLRDPARRRPWTPEEDRLLGTAGDADIARRLNRTLSGVKSRRKKLNIPAWRPR